jgi:SAM-dependent methyltransferase
MQVFDRAHVRRHRARAHADCDFLFRYALNSIGERLLDVRREFPLALQTGTRPGLTLATPRIARLVTMDWQDAEIAGDDEFLPFAAGTFDLIASCFNLHNVNDVPGALAQAKRALKPDGLFIAAFLGGETLRELRESMMQAEMQVSGGVSPRVAPFADKQDAGALMQRAQFALPVVDSERIVVTYDHPLKLMRELRLMGEANAVSARSRRIPPRELFAAASDYYIKNFSDPDGRVRATFEIIVMTGWSPHESQQQPLRPGSGKIALADALGTVEQGAGEKP